MRVDRAGLVLALSMALAGGCSRAGDKVCLGKGCFIVETVRSDEARARGLMFRPALEEGRGMFFVFDREDIHPFWMKNMSFGIDIIWLDKESRVVFIQPDAPPCRTGACPVYTPPAASMFVLEVPAGAAARNGIRAGDTARR